MARAPVATALPPRSRLERRERLRERLVEAGGDALLVLALPNIRYLTGFTGSAGILILNPEPPDVFLTDFRYKTQVAAELDSGVVVVMVVEKPLTAARERLAAELVVLFESAHLSVADWQAWREAEGPALTGVAGWVEELRAVKSLAEIEAIRRAAGVAGRAFTELLADVREGVTERALAARLDRRLIELGAERAAFETIVAFGERSALPHARPSERALARGEIVLFDFGAVVDGYACDMTRTVAFGEPPPELRRVYRIVQGAQQAALEGIREGLTGKEADALAREPIEAAGYGARFGHSLGHGIGLEVHENPRLARTSEHVLAAGMVVTVEPGIYIENLGGVRIEDNAVIGPEAAEILTGASNLASASNQGLVVL